MSDQGASPMNFEADDDDRVAIPYDCLILVLKLLPFSTRVVCERVCHEWRDASLKCNAGNQTSLCFFAKPRWEVSHKSIQSFCSDPSHDIDFETDCIFADVDTCPVMLIHVLAKTPNLRALHLKCFEEESLFTDGIEYMQQLCPKIEHLSLSDDTRGCYIYREGLSIIKNCTCLRHLQLRFPAEGTFDFLLENTILRKSLVMFSNSLETLSTNLPLSSENCEIIANECLLTRLSLQGTSATLEGLTMLCTSPTQCLQFLSICVDWNLQLNLISQYLSQLETLRCTIASSEVTNIQCLSKLRQLKCLFLSVWTKEPLDNDIIAIMKGCRRLESLSINGEVTDASLSRLSEFCPNLERLEIALNSDAKSVSDETLSRGLSRLPNLKYLALNHCHVTDDGMRALLVNNQRLVFIRVTGADNLSLAILPVLEEFARRRPLIGITVVLPKSLVAPVASSSSSSGDSKIFDRRDSIKKSREEIRESLRRDSSFKFNHKLLRDDRDNAFEDWLHLQAAPNLYLKFH